MAQIYVDSQVAGDGRDRPKEAGRLLPRLGFEFGVAWDVESASLISPESLRNRGQLTYGIGNPISPLTMDKDGPKKWAILSRD